MAFFDSLKDSLKHKWVQFFQSNRFWIDLHSDTVATPDGGKRPASYLILGVISALEPQLAQLMLPFSKLNSDVDALIDVLGLNFDPMMLGDRSGVEKQVDTASTSQQQEPSSQLSDGLLNERVIIRYQDESAVAGDEESEAFTVTSLSELIVDEAIPVTDTEDNQADEFSNAFLAKAYEPNLDFEQTFDETYLEDESQSNNDISRLFPFN